jgi:hypothetical protein
MGYGRPPKGGRAFTGKDAYSCRRPFSFKCNEGLCLCLKGAAKESGTEKWLGLQTFFVRGISPHTWPIGSTGTDPRICVRRTDRNS